MICLNTRFPLSIEPLKEGRYLATGSLLHGLIAQGRTIAKTLEIAQDMARKLIESYIEHGDPSPQELSTVDVRKIKLETNIFVEIVR